MEISISVEELIKQWLAPPIAERFIVSEVESARFLQEFFEAPCPYMRELFGYFKGKRVSGEEEKLKKRTEASLKSWLQFYEKRAFHEHRDHMTHEAYRALLAEEFPVMLTSVLLEAFPKFWSFMEDLARKTHEREKYMRFMRHNRFN